jgi:hypothetical protein
MIGKKESVNAIWSQSGRALCKWELRAPAALFVLELERFLCNVCLGFQSLIRLLLPAGSCYVGRC